MFFLWRKNYQNFFNFYSQHSLGREWPLLVQRFKVIRKGFLQIKNRVNINAIRFEGEILFLIKEFNTQHNLNLNIFKTLKKIKIKRENIRFILLAYYFSVLTKV